LSWQKFGKKKRNKRWLIENISLLLYALFKTGLHKEPGLLQLLHNGDQTAFATIYNMTWLPVFKICLKLTGDKSMAEDIAAETFIALWNKKPLFDHPAKAEAFLFSTAHNASLNFLRGQKRMEQRIAEHAKLEDRQTEINFNEEVMIYMYDYLFKRIGELPEKMQAVIKLQLEGKKNTEIAAELNIAEKSVRNLKSEAIKLLRNLMPKEELLLFFMFFWDKS
jgi:RNA polymerase sigma-70 factor, ECF subfamily